MLRSVFLEFVIIEHISCVSIVMNDKDTIKVGNDNEILTDGKLGIWLDARWLGSAEVS